MLAPLPLDNNTVIASDDAWLKPRRFAALLAFFTFAAFPQVWLGLQTFVYRDFGLFSYPLAFHFRESFWRGELPLWNPLSNCGIPFLAQWNTQVLYPPALFYLIFPLSWSLGVFCLLHLFWGGLGMYFLAQGWTQNRFAAAFAAIAFAFSGIMLSSLIWPGTIAGLGWMPWVVWLTVRAWRSGGKVLILAALAGAMQMLSGAAEVVLLTWLLLGSLSVADLVQGNHPRGKIIRRAGLVVVLIAALSAAQLLPFLDLLDHSRLQQDISAAVWPMPATGWANFLVPMFHEVSYQGVFIQGNQSWVASYYVGGTVIALALLAVWRLRQGRLWLLAGLAVFCLVLALGDATPIYGWVSRSVGIIGLMRFPVKFVVVAVLVLPLLAACALAERPLPSARAAKRRRWQWSFLGLGTLMLMLGLIWSNRQFPASDADRTIMLGNGAFHAVFFAVIFLGCFQLGKISNLKARTSWQFLLLAMLWLDLSRSAPAPQTVNRSIYQPEMSRTLPPPQWGLSRAMIPSAHRETFNHRVLADATSDYLARRFALMGDCNLIESVPKLDGFYALYLSDYAVWFYNYYHDDQPAQPLLDFIGVSQTLVLQTNRFAWQARSTFMPLLTGGQKPVFLEDMATLARLTSNDFNPRAEVFLPLAATNLITASNSSPMAISAVQYAAQRIEADVRAEHPGMMVAAQTYYHPWQAYVDGKQTPLWRANYAFQAFEVPPGSHHVRLVYEDRRFYLGAVVSLTTLAGCLACYFWRRRPAVEATAAR